MSISKDEYFGAIKHKLAEMASEIKGTQLVSEVEDFLKGNS